MSDFAELARQISPVSEPEAKVSALSPYATAHAALASNGYTSLPIAEGKKYPGQFSDKAGWHQMFGWTKWRDTPQPDFVRKLWAQWPSAGIGVLTGTPVGDDGSILAALDIDTDDDGLISRIESAVPAANVRKRGAKGYSGFYAVPAGTRDQRFCRDGKVFCELMTMRQTVVPPSVHRDTKRAYVYLTPGTLENTKATDLVTLSDADLDRLLDTLAHLDDGSGVRATERAVTAASAGDESPFRAMNNAALADLDKWVPYLGLTKLRRKGAGSYEAVPDFRPSSTGRPLEQRSPNLGIHADGIRDFGTSRTYSALDLVMAVQGVTFDTAFTWLADRLGLLQDTLTDDQVEGLLARSVAARVEPQPATLSDGTAYDPETGEITMPAPLRAVLATSTSTPALSAALFWDGDPIGRPPAFQVRDLVPEGSSTLLTGRSGDGKTFVAILYAVCGATGLPFFGKATKRFGTLYLAAEAGGTIVERIHAVRVGRIQDAFEAATLSGETPSYDPNALPIAVAMSVPNLLLPANCERIIAMARQVDAKMQSTHGVPLGLIVIDTVAAAFALADENSAAEGAKVMTILGQICRQSGANVMAVHHHGKDISRGVRGSSAFTAGADVILTCVREGDDLSGTVTRRTLALTKTRRGATGWQGEFELKPVVVGTDMDGFDVVSCWVEPSESTQRMATVPAKRETRANRAFRDAFNEALAAGIDIRVLGDGPLVKAAKLPAVREEFYRRYVSDEVGDQAKLAAAKRKAFRRALDTAVSSGFATEDRDGLALIWLANGGLMQ